MMVGLTFLFLTALSLNSKVLLDAIFLALCKPLWVLFFVPLRFLIIQHKLTYLISCGIEYKIIPSVKLIKCIQENLGVVRFEVGVIINGRAIFIQCVHTQLVL